MAACTPGGSSSTGTWAVTARAAAPRSSREGRRPHHVVVPEGAEQLTAVEPLVADVLFAHDDGRLEPGPPDVALQRRAAALGRPFWWARPVGTAGALVAAAGFVVAPSNTPGIALMACGAVVVVAAFVVRRLVGRPYGEATAAAGLPVPPERSEELRAVAVAIEETLLGISDAGRDGLLPPQTKRIHARARAWDRESDRLRRHWLRGDDARWRSGAAWLADQGADIERWRREVDEHVRLHRDAEEP